MNNQDIKHLPTHIELLSPAKNLECGIEAIKHGADAIYIGAPKFGARAAAANSIKDLEQVIRYAHLFRAKVLITLNTIFTDSELEEVQKLIRQLYHIGADALIIQDMGILQLDLPPIALHASTQMDNRTPEKVKFLENEGFKRVVLARELSLEQIAKIRKQTQIELEAFVHGSLCVSYSGQCYLSHACCGRSANRGECAQYCRLPYSLQDTNGNILIDKKHLLSLKDMDRSDFLYEMMMAGITTFKIEGRLKEVNYVKNVTAFYRQKIDLILEANPTHFQRTSVGKSTFFFMPHPKKSFNRGKTDYFLYNRKQDITQFGTPKSIGEEVGTVDKVYSQYLTVSTNAELHNGDGLCFFNQFGVFDGFRINQITENKIFPAEMPAISSGVILYRNFDHEFEKQLQHKSAERKIALDLVFQETSNGFELHISDEIGSTVSYPINCEKIEAQKEEQALQNIKTQLAKLGDTIYYARTVSLHLKQAYFFPLSQLAAYKREAVQQLSSLSTEKQPFVRKQIKPNPYPAVSRGYTLNIMNEQAARFYREHGLIDIEPAFERKPDSEVILMYCKHCIKYALGWCPKQKNQNIPDFREPLYLKLNQQLFELTFHCSQCEMTLRFTTTCRQK